MKRHIPNAITCCNLISGCIAIHFAFGYAYQLALLFICIGAVFDFFDGMSARLLGVSSPIGKELDSLADVVTFGVAPSAILFAFLSTNVSPTVGIGSYIPYVAFLIAAFSALRLAKFNLDTRQATSFIGLPTPANALFWGSLIVGSGSWIATSLWAIMAMLLLVLVACWAMVSEVPMFALKFKHWGWRGNGLRYGFLISCVPLLAVLRVSGFAAIVAWYVVLSAIADIRKPKANA